VVFNEVHYHPSEGQSTPEFIEIYNQNSINVDISGWRITGGVAFEFPEETVILGGGYLVVSADPSALALADGPVGALGPFIGKLSNSGELIRLRNHNNRLMDEFEYDDKAPWPVGADGSGATLAKIKNLTSSGSAKNWGHSKQIGGTPGAENFVLNPQSGSVTINEVAGSLDTQFWIELHNSRNQLVSLDGYLLVFGDEGEYIFPQGAEIAPGGVLVINAASLSLSALPMSEEVINLFLPGRTELLDVVRVKDLAMARFPDGAEWMTVGQLAEQSPGEENFVTINDQVVINEIMYHHRPQYAEAGDPAIPYIENSEEWVELYNKSSSPSDLSNWSLAGGVHYDFPTGTSIPPGGYLIVARDLAAFAAKYPGVNAVGDFTGRLADSGAELRLLDSYNNPSDSLTYYDGAPWPEAADSGGSSMELRNPDIDNALAASWGSSDQASTSSWHTYEYTLTAQNPFFRPNQYNFTEIRLGLLEAGEILIDDLSVIEDPNGANTELLANGSFDTLTGWRLLGTHRESDVISDGGQNVLRVHASGRFNYLNNLIESNLTLADGSLRPITNGMEYKVSFRAKWVSGSPQFRFEFYYNKLAKLVVLKQPMASGTPGSQNSNYRANVGPDIWGLKHSPSVPEAGEPITISAHAGDVDGVGSVTLKYSLNEGSFQSQTMVHDGDGLWTGVIPAASDGTIIQFYLEAEDQSANQSVSYAPARGINSRALIKIATPNLGTLKHSIRINMLASDASLMHDQNKTISNARHGCTVITDENTIAYDAGVRLRGSMYSRRLEDLTGLNLKLPADQSYRGARSTITIRRRSLKEIVAKHIINAVGGINDNYNDIVRFNGHIAAQDGQARIEMTRFTNSYLKDLPGGNGDDGTVFKMEGIREFYLTQDGTPDTPKKPFHIKWVPSFDLADQGDDKEIYRHNISINTALSRDDYSGAIAMCKLFSLSGQELEDTAPSVIDVDRWMRQFALLSLCGVKDTYSQKNPHNLNFFARPDGLVEPMPWDWDQVFILSTSAPIFGNRNLSKLYGRPIYRRLFYGHLLDMMDGKFNTGYLTEWLNYLGDCTGEDYSAYAGRVNARVSFVLSQLPVQVPFAITSNAGNDFSVNDSTVLLTGDGWIDVHEVYINGLPSPLKITWQDGDSWKIQLSLAPGANPLALVAKNRQGQIVGSDNINITNTGMVEPASSSTLVISEVHYHPDGDADTEYIELQNIDTSATIDLTGLTFTQGIDFTFPKNTMLVPGERLLVVQNYVAISSMYGNGLRVVGVFENGTRLSNSGERIRLESAAGIVIQDFTYNDSFPWPNSADADGASIVLILPESNPDQTLPENWRPSAAWGGNPGTSDATTFSGGDLSEYAIGSDGLTQLVITDSGHLAFTFPRRLSADDISYTVEISDDLVNWTPNSGKFVASSMQNLENGMAEVTFKSLDSAGTLSQRYVRLVMKKK